MQSSLVSKFSQFVKGFTTPVRALKLIFERPKLLGYCLFPIIITLVVAATCVYAVLTGAWALASAWFQNFAGVYANVASGIFAFIIGLFTLYLMFHSIGLLISFFSSPFNDLLAEETERAQGQAPIKLRLGIFLRVFFLDLRKTILTLAASVGLWFLALMPGLGLLAPFGFALISTLTFISYSQSRRQLGVIACLIWMRENFLVSLGFGFATMVLFGAPVLNAFALPLSVVGGTLLYLENEKTKSA